jgi:hypothetical protein
LFAVPGFTPAKPLMFDPPRESTLADISCHRTVAMFIGACDS